MTKKGFTLLELVIVIGILAVLGAVSVLVLNPAQLFAQARDTTRIEDMSVVRNALALYVSTITSPAMGDSAKCYIGTDVAAGSFAANCAGRHAVSRVTTLVATATAKGVTGSGWVPVDFTTVPGGPALSVLPLDPTNDATYFYSYAADNTAKTFELNTHMESTRYHNGGTEDKESKDGGNDANVYEVGTASGLAL